MTRSSVACTKNITIVNDASRIVDYAPTVMLHIVTLTQVYLPPLDSSIIFIVQATVTRQ